MLSQRLVSEAKNHLSKAHSPGQPGGRHLVWPHQSPYPPACCWPSRLDVNEWKGERKVQFLVEGAQV